MLKNPGLVLAFLALTVFLIIFAPAENSSAGCKKNGLTGFTQGKVKAEASSTCPDGEGTSGGGGGSGGAGSKELSPEAQYKNEMIEWQQCRRFAAEMATRGQTPTNCGAPPTRPTAGPPPPALTNAEIAEIAVAEMDIPEPIINIGPSPDLNPWKSAVVGVNYWFFVSGTTSIPTTGQSVGSVSAHLSARITGLTINTNANARDAVILKCAGPGVPWKQGTPLSEESPTCGHVYTTPTTAAIRATVIWTVSWEVNGETGTTTLARTATLDVPVKELHSVNR